MSDYGGPARRPSHRLSVSGPCLTDQATHRDDRVGQVEEGVDHVLVSLAAFARIFKFPANPGPESVAPSRRAVPGTAQVIGTVKVWSLGALWDWRLSGDLREPRVPAGPEELAAFEADVLAGFVLARAAAGLSDRTISLNITHLEQIRAWFGRPLWEIAPADADAYFGKAPRGAARGIRLSRAQALRTSFMFPELRHKTTIHS